jgi:hypothetical protein
MCVGSHQHGTASDPSAPLTARTRNLRSKARITRMRILVQNSTAAIAPRTHRDRRLRGKKGNLCSHCGAATGFALELKRPMQLAHTLPHIDQAKASGFSNSIYRKTHTVIGYGQANSAIGTGKPDLNSLSCGMFCDIPECFLRNSINGQRSSWGQLLQCTVSLARNGNAACLAELCAIRGQSRCQIDLL